MTAVTRAIAPEKAELALEFVAFAKASYEMAILQWSMLGFDPVRWDVYDDPELRKPSPALDFFGAEVLEVLKDVADETAGSKFSAQNAFVIRDYVMVNVMPNVIAENNKDATTALTEAQAVLEAQLK